MIWPYKKPMKKQAGFLNLKGNLFDSAIMKTSVISDEFRERYLSNPKDPNAFEGRAIVFDGPEDYHHRIDDPKLKIDDDCLLFVRGTGPMGYPGAAEVVNMQPPAYLIKKGITELPCIGDGRQSGTSGSPSILNASPEAASGGGLAILKTGDLVRIDLNKRTRQHPHQQGGTERAPRGARGAGRLQVPAEPDALAGDPARHGRRAVQRHGAQARGEVPEDPRPRACRGTITDLTARARHEEQSHHLRRWQLLAVVENGLNAHFTVVREPHLEVRGIAVSGGHTRIDAAFVELFPRLEIVASFGVGYDHIDAADAGGARHRRHAHARRAHRRGRRPGAGSADRHRAPAAAGGPLPARRQVAEDGPIR